MPTILDNLVNALLADAAYADNLTDGLSGDDLSRELRTRMTPELAGFIVHNFGVVSHIESDDVFASGFDATVWRGRTGTPFEGRIYVSMQGTAGLQDFLTDAQLAVNGNAGQQVIDMANWWFRITTPIGEMARQIDRRVDAVSGETVLVSATEVPGSGLVPAADLIRGVEVNGHSLGGYLAAAFTRLFGSHAHVTQTTTFNSAGFAPGSERAFSAFADAIGHGYGRDAFPGPNDPSQVNAFAVHGLNLTTNTLWFNQVGLRLGVFNELSGLAGTCRTTSCTS